MYSNVYTSLSLFSLCFGGMLNDSTQPDTLSLCLLLSPLSAN